MSALGASQHMEEAPLLADADVQGDPPPPHGRGPLRYGRAPSIVAVALVVAVALAVVAGGLLPRRGAAAGAAVVESGLRGTIELVDPEPEPEGGGDDSDGDEDAEGGSEVEAGGEVESGSEPYDCEAGYSNWEAGWSDDKKEWCCANKQMGCPASEPYDCQAGYSNWEAGWSADKKVWCCTNKKMGCGDGPDTSPTPGPAGSGDSGGGTPGSPCTCDSGDNGVYGTCAKGEVGCCSSRGIKCDGGAAAPPPTLAISTGGAGAGALPVPTIASPVPSIDLPMSASPSASPVVGGSPAPGTKCTCTVGAPDGAYKAGDNGVYGNCIKGEVGCCSSSAVKCDGGGSMTPPTLTLSTSGASADTLPASTSGASANTLPASTSEPYDCQAGYSNWEAGWSEDKKAWCCDVKKMGCAASGGGD